LKTVFFFGNFLSKSVGVHSVGEELAEILTLRGYKILTASSFRNRFFRMIDFLSKAVIYKEHYQVAFIDVFSDLAFVYAETLSCLLTLMQKTIILTLHGGKLPQFAEKYPGRFTKVIKKADVVTTPSKYLLNEFQFVCPGIRYIPNGIEINQYPNFIRKDPQPSLIWLRAFHAIYSPGLAIEVLKKTLDEYPHAHLRMIGPDKGDGTFDRAKELVHQLGVENNITFVGPVDKRKVGEFLSRGDIFLNTTIYESFGVSTIEAAACGLCIVTTNVGELPYMWEDGVDALLVPPNDPDAMAAAVKRILEEPGLAEKLSRNARKKAEQFDWSIVIPQWESLINSLVEDR